MWHILIVFLGFVQNFLTGYYKIRGLMFILPMKKRHISFNVYNPRTIVVSPTGRQTISIIYCGTFQVTLNSILR